jgi:hypothetical protein
MSEIVSDWRKIVRGNFPFRDQIGLKFQDQSVSPQAWLQDLFTTKPWPPRTRPNLGISRGTKYRWAADRLSLRSSLILALTLVHKPLTRFRISCESCVPSIVPLLVR